MELFSNNPITRLFGIQYPIVQGGMVWASGWRLASAVSNAGGLGLIGAGSMYPEVLQHHIRQCKQATQQPYGVNIPLMYPDVPALIQIIIEEKVPIVFTSAGNPKIWTATKFANVESVDLFRNNQAIDFFLLNDGSSDNTLNILNLFALDYNWVNVLNYEINSGKGEVVRASMLAVSAKDYDVIGFWDSDFATPFEEFVGISEACGTNNFDIVVSARIKLRGWEVKRNEFRHWASRILLTFINIVFKLEIYDTQCGCKVFNQSVVNKLFADKFITRWLFDMEVFIRYMKLHPRHEQKIFELPVKSWQEVKGSKLKLKDFILVPFNVMKLVFHYKV